MFKYYAIATCIVLSIAVAVTAWNNRELIRIRIASTSLSAPPKAAPTSDLTHRANLPVTGDAPWALSALPDCFTQQSQADGPLAYLRAKIPSNASKVASGTWLRYGPCNVLVKDNEAYVRRGEDAMRIPPDVTVYTAQRVLVILRTQGKGGELRVYSTKFDQQ